MIRKFDLDTDGVLIIVAKNALKAAFADTPFDYSFPEGFLPLVEAGSVIAVVTESGEDVKGRLLIDKTEDTSGFDLLGTQGFRVDADDEIFVLSHSEFTQICDWHKGDIEAFIFRDKKTSLAKVPAGFYTANIYAKQPKNSYLLHFIVQLSSSAIAYQAETPANVFRF